MKPISPNNTLITKTLTQAEWTIIITALRSLDRESVHIANKLNLPQCENSIAQNEWCVRIKDLENERDELIDENIQKDKEIRSLYDKLPMQFQIIDWSKIFVKLSKNEEGNLPK